MEPRETEVRPTGWLRRLPPGLKLACALALVTGTVLLPRRPDIRYVVPAAILLLLWISSRMPLGLTLRRLLVAETFIIGLGLLTLLTPSATPVFLAALFKSNLCVLAMLLLTWTTAFQDLLAVLRRVGLPPTFLSVLTLTCRYLPVLAAESKRMQRARASRTFSTEQRLAWRTLSEVIGRLFVRTADRAERIYLAMCARGWK